MIRRGLATALAVLSCGWLCAGPLLAGSAAAAPLSIEQCTTTSGAIVAVDFGHWGGPIVRACGSTPTTGFTLLNQGGFRSTGTSHDGPAFVCRIASASYRSGTSYPTPANDPCVRTPASTAYWSFWHANPGQSGWSYSSVGATSFRPSPGSVELWQFGATNRSGSSGQPAVSPAALRARNAPQATRPATTAAPRSTGASSAAPAKPGTPGATSSRPTSAGRVPASPAAPTAAASPTRPASPAAPQSTAAAATVPPLSVTTARGRSAVPRPTVAVSPGPASSSPAALGRTRPSTTTPATTAPSDPTVAASGSVASADRSDAAGGPGVVDATQTAAAAAAGHGSARGVVIGIALVVALGVAGALTAARRSRP